MMIEQLVLNIVVELEQSMMIEQLVQSKIDLVLSKMKMIVVDQLVVVVVVQLLDLLQ